MRKINKNSQSLYDWCKENEKEILLKEWDYSNNIYSPKDYSRASKECVKWICSKCNDSFSMSIQSRTLKNSICKKCSLKEKNEKERIKRIAEKGSLAEIFPDMLKKWNYEKNKDISPYDVSPKSCIKVWWKCPNCGYEFFESVCYVRTSTSCRHCRGNKYVDSGRDGTYTVYCHLSPSGKRYIGFTGMPIKTRFGNGKHYSRNTVFGKAIEKYGWENFEHIVLETGLTKEQASEKEIYYIKKYNTLDDKFGYNIATGGINGKIFGRIVSEETKQKIGKANKGRKATEETIKKLKESHIGKESHNTRAVCKYDLSGNFIQEYKSIAYAVRCNENIDSQRIWKCCTGRAKTAGGYIWKYK